MKINSFILAFAAAALCASCVKGPTSVSLSPSSLSLTEGETAELTANVLPEDAKYGSISWSSADSKVATVSGGRVTAVGAGSTTITATTEGVSGSASVTVARKVVKVSGVSLDKETLELVKGQEASLVATISPSDAADKSCSWTSSDDKVVSVDQNGKVKAVDEGTAVVTVKTGDGGLTASCKVTVAHDPIPVKSVSLDKDSIELVEGEEATLVATVSPDNADDKSLSWKSSDESVVTVDQYGQVRAVKPGTATVTVTTTDGGFKASCKVTVTPAPIPVESLAIDQDIVIVGVGGTVKLNASITPADATDQSLAWGSSQEDVATVDNDGLVTTKAVGYATIWVKSLSNPQAYAECVVQVVLMPESIEVTKDHLEMLPGDKEYLHATLNPSDAYFVGFEWSSSNSGVAIVDQNGTVTSVAPGECDIVVKCGDLTKTIKVVVYRAPESLTLNYNTFEMFTDETVALTATVSPEDALPLSISWRSGDPDIASVDQFGQVTGLNPGWARIIATGTSDVLPTDMMAWCDVLVKEHIHVSSFFIDYYDDFQPVLQYGETVRLKVKIYPVQAENKDYYVESSDENVLMVYRSEEGDNNDFFTVEAVGPGTAKVIGTTVDGGKKAELELSVNMPVSSITIDRESISLVERETMKLTATVHPANASHPNYYWSSENSSVASVDDNGVVTANREGTTRVYAQTTYSPRKTAYCDVTVVKRQVPVSSITILSNWDKIGTGSNYSLHAEVLPYGATNNGVTWTSSNPSVLYIDNASQYSTDAYANAHGVKAGKAVITVKSDKYPSVYDSMEVTVYDSGAQNIPVTGITVDPTSLTMKPGDSRNLAVQVYPYGTNGATNPRYSISSSDPSVATVTENAKITAIKAGQTTIIATTEDGGFTAKCVVTVNSSGTGGGTGGGGGSTGGGDTPPAQTIPVQRVDITNVAMDNGIAYFDVGQSIDAIAKITPSNASNRRVTWSSSNNAVASVQSYGNDKDGSPIGRIKCLSPGTTRISVKTADGSHTDWFELQVVISAKSVSLVDPKTGEVLGSSITIKKGDARAIMALLTPSNTTDTFFWTEEGAIDIESKSATSVLIRGREKGSGRLTVTVNRVWNVFKTVYVTVE